MVGGCGGGGGGGGDAVMPTPGLAPTSVSLTVNGGVGPASVTVGGQAEVWSTIAAESEVLTRWTGAGIVGDDEEWHVTVAAGTSPLVLTAQRQPLPIVFDTLSYSAPTAVGKTLRYHVPPAPKGVILLLHGTYGSNSFIEKTEARSMALKAISKGYAVLSPEAEEAVAGDLNGDGKPRWDVVLSNTNTDLRSLDAMLAQMVASGKLPANLPQYVIGMSNGGSMAVALGAVAGTASAGLFPRLRFKAVISYCAQARADAISLTQTPTAWHLCGSDDNADVSNTNAQANSASLAARGVPTFVALHPATPLIDERFVRVSGVSLAQSKALAAELRAAGLLDASSMFKVSTSDIVAQASASPARFPTLAALTAQQQKDVVSQISVMRAEHEMFSDWASRALRWFASYP
jgi:dienelactone hydrolase